MVIDPVALEKETGELEALGVEVGENLLISDRAHLILPHHRALEALSEEARGARKIGTTLRGIGPAYEDKAGRRGVRIGDLLRPATLPDKLAEARRHYEQVLRGAGRAPDVDWERLIADLVAFGERLRSRITRRLAGAASADGQGYSVLFEGAQATLLDLDHGTYPFVTSSSAGGGGSRDRDRRAAHADRRRPGRGEGLHARGWAPAPSRPSSRATWPTRCASAAASTAPPPAGRGAAAGSTPWPSDTPCA